MESDEPILDPDPILTTKENCAVIIADTDVAAQLLEKDNDEIEKSKISTESKKYLGKYWLFFDEPTYGADSVKSRNLMSNTKIFYNMPRWTILSSATLPTPDKVPDIVYHYIKKFTVDTTNDPTANLNKVINFYNNKFNIKVDTDYGNEVKTDHVDEVVTVLPTGAVFIDTLITKEIIIGCDVKTFENKIVLPYTGCNNKEDLLNCISKINTVPQFSRFMTPHVAKNLWDTIKSYNLDIDISDIKTHFSNVENLKADKVRIFCIDMLTKLSELDSEIIRIVCHDTNKLFVPHYGCKNREELLTRISEINRIPQYRKFITPEFAKILAKNLWEIMNNKKLTIITDMFNITELIESNAYDFYKGMLTKLSELNPLYFSTAKSFIPTDDNFITPLLVTNLLRTMRDNNLTLIVDTIDVTNLTELNSHTVYFDILAKLSSELYQNLESKYLTALQNMFKPFIYKQSIDHSIRQNEININNVCNPDINEETNNEAKKKSSEINDEFFKNIGDEFFKNIGRENASKFLNMNLIVSTNPFNLLKRLFTDLYDDIIIDLSPDSDKEQLKSFSFAKFKRSFNTKKDEESTSTKKSKIGNKKGDKDDIDTKKKDDVANIQEVNLKSKFQINTLQHYKNYKQKHVIDTDNLRRDILGRDISIDDINSEDIFKFLLLSGVGVYAPDKTTDTVYTREVMNLAENGKLAFLISDISIAYGSNLKDLCRVFIMPDFAQKHSLNTIFQVMGRAGRAGRSWNAEVFIDENTVKRIKKFMLNLDNGSSNKEAEHIGLKFTDYSTKMIDINTQKKLPLQRQYELAQRVVKFQSQMEIQKKNQEKAKEEADRRTATQKAKEEDDRQKAKEEADWDDKEENLPDWDDDTKEEPDRQKADRDDDTNIDAWDNNPQLSEDKQYTIMKKLKTGDIITISYNDINNNVLEDTFEVLFVNRESDGGFLCKFMTNKKLYAFIWSDFILQRNAVLKNYEYNILKIMNPDGSIIFIDNNQELPIDPKSSYLLEDYEPRMNDSIIIEYTDIENQLRTKEVKIIHIEQVSARSNHSGFRKLFRNMVFVYRDKMGNITLKNWGSIVFDDIDIIDYKSIKEKINNEGYLKKQPSYKGDPVDNSPFKLLKIYRNNHLVNIQEVLKNLKWMIDSKKFKPPYEIPKNANINFLKKKLFKGNVLIAKKFLEENKQIVSKIFCIVDIEGEFLYINEYLDTYITNYEIEKEKQKNLEKQKKLEKRNKDRIDSVEIDSTVTKVDIYKDIFIGVTEFLSSKYNFSDIVINEKDLHSESQIYISSILPIFTNFQVIQVKRFIENKLVDCDLLIEGLDKEHIDVVQFNINGDREWYRKISLYNIVTNIENLPNSEDYIFIRNDSDEYLKLKLPITVPESATRNFFLSYLRVDVIIYARINNNKEFLDYRINRIFERKLHTYLEIIITDEKSKPRKPSTLLTFNFKNIYYGSSHSNTLNDGLYILKIKPGIETSKQTPKPSKETPNPYKQTSKQTPKPSLRLTDPSQSFADIILEKKGTMRPTVSETLEEKRTMLTTVSETPTETHTMLSLKPRLKLPMGTISFKSNRIPPYTPQENVEFLKNNLQIGQILVNTVSYSPELSKTVVNNLIIKEIIINKKNHNNNKNPEMDRIRVVNEGIPRWEKEIRLSNIYSRATQDTFNIEKQGDKVYHRIYFEYILPVGSISDAEYNVEIPPPELYPDWFTPIPPFDRQLQKGGILIAAKYVPNTQKLIRTILIINNIIRNSMSVSELDESGKISIGEKNINFANIYTNPEILLKDKNPANCLHISIILPPASIVDFKKNLTPPFDIPRDLTVKNRVKFLKNNLTTNGKQVLVAKRYTRNSTTGEPEPHDCELWLTDITGDYLNIVELQDNKTIWTSSGLQFEDIYSDIDKFDNLKKGNKLSSLYISRVLDAQESMEAINSNLKQLQQQ